MKPRSSDKVANKRTPGSVTSCIGRRIKNHPNDSEFSLCLDLLRNFFLISKIIKPVYLDVIAVGAVNVENNTALVASSWTVTADHAFAKSDALVGQDKLVENVFAISDAVFDDALLQRMAVSDKTVVLNRNLKIKTWKKRLKCRIRKKSVGHISITATTYDGRFQFITPRSRPCCKSPYRAIYLSEFHELFH